MAIPMTEVSIEELQGRRADALLFGAMVRGSSGNGDVPRQDRVGRYRAGLRVNGQSHGISMLRMVSTDGKQRESAIFAVLEVPPVKSALDAVRAAIVQMQRFSSNRH